ncbi:peptidoglycan editing factor PgeF [Povalibacter sp.]|uniref:peptidoglycan editing factor PgeF n=1 Tax=Povalibacter sp. TaxID=1962978 RepID=UPI002F40C4E9
MTALTWLTPDWPAPSNVRAAVTLRPGGVSTGDFAGLNLATHVGDAPSAVVENRRRLREALQLPAEPAWLNQVHGVAVVEATPQSTPATADASIARAANQVCVIMTADCLPVLFCDRAGTRVGAAHAGWRGLVGGVLGETIKALSVDPQNLLAWLGPAIEPAAFEVGEEVREQFVNRDSVNTAAFERNARGRWQADLYELARNELRSLGVTRIYGGDFSVFADAERFFSYRRAAKTGRMATMVWLEECELGPGL